MIVSVLLGLAPISLMLWFGASFLFFAYLTIFPHGVSFAEEDMSSVAAQERHPVTEPGTEGRTTQERPAGSQRAA
jgi:hypothetical protein